MNIEKRRVNNLLGWDKNPRGLKEDDYKRLVNQVMKLGQYKPLLINQDNVVLGGNMRLKVYQELGFEEVFVSVVETKTEAEMIEYALSDNDNVGYYIEDNLTELVYNIKDEIDLDMYKVNFDFSNISLNDVISENTDFENIEENKNREKQFKKQLVTCPHCKESFEIEI